MPVAASGHVSPALSGEDYIELLPSCWRAVNDYGIRIQGRTYDVKQLGPLRRRHSGITAKTRRTSSAGPPRQNTKVFSRL